MKAKIKQFSIFVLNDTKTKTSFCWQHFGDLVIEEDYKKKKVCNDQVFCNTCLTAAQKDNDEISFGLKSKNFAKKKKTFVCNVTNNTTPERISEHLEMDENEPIIDDEGSESNSVSGLQTSDEFGT
ncbi:unnamed protein product [Parnassius apollo]|uniref:(apollo) hypothetical protein n=1 Tax=Parnassius apollo TaxID=110799 RepID=A0A8S3XCR5_PARAO|nr:unnamed protein product [Parnassius apollo]